MNNALLAQTKIDLQQHNGWCVNGVIETGDTDTRYPCPWCREHPRAEATIASYIACMKLDERPIDWVEIHDALCLDMGEREADVAIDVYCVDHPEVIA